MTNQQFNYHYNLWRNHTLNILNWHVNIIQSLSSQLQCSRKRVYAAVFGSLMHLERKTYKKKRYWVSPLCADRKEHGFYVAIFPKLHLEHLGFYNYFRMSATKFEELLNMVGPLISKQTVIRDPISAGERLALTLRFLASGDLIHSFHYSYLVGVTTASKIIAETCSAIWRVLKPQVLPSKISKSKWIKIARRFESEWQFPLAIGAEDGKHIIIECPDNAGSMYYNYKGSHSVVLLGVCDADYVFTVVDIGAYGRRSDGGIFKESILGKKLENNELDIPEPVWISNKRSMPLPYCLLGDQAFPLKPYLLRPYPKNKHLTKERKIFNYRLTRARRTIENTFGILAAKWRIFKRAFAASDPNIVSYVQAAVCLHNWLRMADLSKESKVSYVEDDLVDREEDGTLIKGRWRKIVEKDTGLADITRTGTNNSTQYCYAMRDQYCAYFNNEGKVMWQDNYI